MMKPLELWSYWMNRLPDSFKAEYDTYGNVELGFLEETIETTPDGYSGVKKKYYFEDGSFHSRLSHWDGGNFTANRSYNHTALDKERFTEILDAKKSQILLELSENERAEFEAVFDTVKSFLISQIK